MIEHIQVIPDKCRACRRCEVACIAAHHGMTFKEAMKHRDLLVSRVQVVKAEGMRTTVRCHQCNPAPCCNICPTGALQQESDGRISMRVQLCIACKLCISACPYGTITLDSVGLSEGTENEGVCMLRNRREVAVRCDMCRAWREENGKTITACMEACPARALSMIGTDGSVIEAPLPEKKAVPPVAAKTAEEKVKPVAPSKELAEQAAREQDSSLVSVPISTPVHTGALRRPEAVVSRPAVPATEAVISELLQAFESVASASHSVTSEPPKEAPITAAKVAASVAAQVTEQQAQTVSTETPSVAPKESRTPSSPSAEKPNTEPKAKMPKKAKANPEKSSGTQGRKKKARE